MWVPYVMMAIVMLVLIIAYATIFIGALFIGSGIVGLLKGFLMISSMKIISGISIIYFSNKFRKKFENFEI